MATQSYDFAPKNMVTSKPNGTVILWKKYWKFFHWVIKAVLVSPYAMVNKKLLKISLYVIMFKSYIT